MSLAKPRKNALLVESPKAYETQGPSMVSLAKPETNALLVKSPKAHQTQDLSLVSLAKPNIFIMLVLSRVHKIHVSSYMAF